MHPVLLVAPVAFVATAAIALVLRQRQRNLQREAHIRSFVLPRGLFDQLRQRHPGLSQKDCQLVAQALRQFFLAHLKSGRAFVAMPSQVVDDLWHAFILYTRNYEDFCRQAFGGFLHHTPAVVLRGGQRQSNAGLRRCFWFACKDDNIDPRRPTRLPLLFAIDAKLAIAGGFHYVVDCQALRRREQEAGSDPGRPAAYCGGDFSSGNIDGSTEGFGPGDGDAASGGDGADGGGGDGGGCGGGGE
jgi:hypothetical protein